MKEMRSEYFLQGVDRAMRVLDCFTTATPELRLTDLSNRLGLNKTQVLRIAFTLEAGGYLVRDPETNRWRLGLRLFHLGNVVRGQMDLRSLAHPVLRSLVERTEETARLVVPSDDGPVCIDLVESPQGIRVYARLGARMPWNAGASPKLLLAYLSEEQRNRILATGTFMRHTDTTITEPDELRREIAAIREQRYAISWGDLTKGACGISAPVFDDQRQIVGAINVTGPADRLSPTEVARIVDLVCEAAGDVSVQLGYVPDRPSSVDSGSSDHDRVPDDPAR